MGSWLPRASFRHVACVLLACACVGLDLAQSQACPKDPSGNICANHGQCDDLTRTCTCDPGYTYSDCSIALSAKVSLSVYNGTLSTLPSQILAIMQTEVKTNSSVYGGLTIEQTPVSPADTVVAMCGVGGCDQNGLTSSHVFGFRDFIPKTGTTLGVTGTQLAYLFSAMISSAASRDAGIVVVRTYMPNGQTRTIVDISNTCPSSGPNAVCAGRGKCVRNGVSPLLTCVCDKGFMGAGCSQVQNCAANGDCSARGVCVRGGQCECDPGWGGKDCSVRQCPADCSGNGNCDSKTGQCTCNAGFGGSDCSLRTCKSRPNITAPGGCSGNGFCDDGSCICDPFYEGEMCDQPVCPFLCNGRGTCDPSTRKCDCNKRFAGADCNIPVCRFGGDTDSVGLSCSGHGVCVTVGFGLDEIVLCNCVEKYYGENCEKLRCPNDCGARGICVNGKCACDDGFNGDACQYFCPGANSSTSPVSFCAGHGECVLTNRFLSGSSGVQLQSCKCVAGWIGEACDLVGCFGS